VLLDTPHATLRVDPRASAVAWWAAARQRRDTPPAVSALLAGRGRVELSALEAADAITWAETVEGWAAAEPKPLFVHRPDATQA
jgi:hypothetical protein